jgi:hypothetical protein
MSLEHFMTKALRDRIDEIERIDRLISIAETRRNAALRPRPAVGGQICIEAYRSTTRSSLMAREIPSTATREVKIGGAYCI